MPILGIYASQISGKLYNASYESIATVTVGSGGASSITFSSIPQTYKHLQIRYITRGTTSGTTDPTFMQFNSDIGDNYARHFLKGDGASASAFAQTGAGIGAIWAANVPFAGVSANIFGSGVIDILDYSDTTKNTTVRTLGGYDANGSGILLLSSGVWLNTAALTRIDFVYPAYAQYTQYALYGIKDVA